MKIVLFENMGFSQSSPGGTEMSIATDHVGAFTASSAPTAAVSGRQRYQYLGRTGKGTPAGELLRRYWQPLALEAELGVDPLPVRIFGEDLVLFIDDQGRTGALDRRCAHRCADLSLGRLEDGGIRCPYHGWLFGVDGRCLDQPAEPSKTGKDRVKARAYPLHKSAGAYWIYMGPGEPPLFPDYPALRGSNDHRYVTKWRADCNWMQGHEGNIDPVHTSYLHKIELNSDDMVARWGVFANNAMPTISIEDTRYGIRLYTLRPLGNGETQSLRVTNFVMPNACAVGGFEGDLGVGGATMLWDVPIDDEHHWRWEFIFHKSGKLDRDGLETQYNKEKQPGTHNMWRTKDDNWAQDRTQMSGVTYAGLGPCFSVHDIVITNSQGAVHNHEGEHLSSSDIAIVRARRLLDEAVQAVAKGDDPRGVVRDKAQQSFNELIVITDVVESTFDKNEYISHLSQDENLYRIV
jgi:phthalate 4,5-dioxygenase oxygenase subunit